MTSDALARDYLRRAQGRRRALEALMSSGDFADVVRESQDVVELVFKGALRFVGIDPPKRHDVHRSLPPFIDRFPSEWRQTVEALAGDLDRLAAERGPAFYGNEADNIPASELFREPDARRALAIVDRLLDLYRRLLGSA